MSINIDEKVLNEEIIKATELREKVHSLPDLSGEEEDTVSTLINFLEGLPISTKLTGKGNGLIVDLDSENPNARKERVAFRADLDALPIHEETGLVFSSVKKGTMHACGHDCHLAIVAGLIQTLCRLKTILPRNYRFIFQPSEEDSTIGGAEEMIRKGVLDGVSSIFAIHLWPDLITGTIGLTPGAIMGSSDRVKISIQGKAAHAGTPQKGIDACVVLASLLLNLQTLISRKRDPFDPCVLSFGRLVAGTGYNVIAKEACLEGTFRTLNQESRNQIEREIRQLTENIAHGFGALSTVDFLRGHPPVINDIELTEKTKALFEIVENISIVQCQPSLLSEDFSRYGEKIPSLFIWVGCTPAKNFLNTDSYKLHSPSFSPDERALGIGMRVLLNIALS